MYNRHRGVSLIKLVVGLALFTGAAMFFADWLIAPVIREAQFKEKMLKRPDFSVLAQDILPEVSENARAAWDRYNGTVVSVTGIVESATDSKTAPVIYLGPKLNGLSVTCYFEGQDRDIHKATPGRMLSIRGIARVSETSFSLRRSQIRTDADGQRAQRAMPTAKPKTVEPKPEPMTARQIQQRNSRAQWNRSKAAGEQDRATKMQFVRQR